MWTQYNMNTSKQSMKKFSTLNTNTYTCLFVFAQITREHRIAQLQEHADLMAMFVQVFRNLI